MSAVTLPCPPAPATPEAPPARPRALAFLGKIALAVLVAAVVSSCARRAPVPTSYGGNNSTVQKNFVAGCTGSKDRQAGDTPSSRSACECEWAGIKKQYPNFADFKKINGDLTTKNAPLPQPMQAIIANCT